MYLLHLTTRFNKMRQGQLARLAGNVLAALCLVSLLPGGCFMSNKDLPISKELQETILEDVAKRTHLPKDHIELSMLVNWDNEKCPIVEGITNVHGVPPRRYALINGEILAANKKENFAKIVQAAFPNVTQEDPITIARLSVMFAHFGAPVGSVWLRDLKADHPEIATPTTTFKPQWKDENGGKVLEFYSFSSPVNTFYFCRVVFKGADPELSAIALNSRS